MKDLFPQFAAYVSRYIGSLWTFLISVALILASGWYFNFSSQWKEMTTFLLSVVTFLFVIFVQKSQSVGDKATHLKLDEIIRALEGARNEVVASEEKAESEIDALKQEAIEAISDTQNGTE